MIHPRAQAAIAQVVETFGEDAVSQVVLADGSIWLDVAGVDLGTGWIPRICTLSVKLAATFPDTPPYPWYLPSGTRRADGAPVDRLSGPIQLDGGSRLQLSLNGPWSQDSSLADRMLGVMRWLRRAGLANRLAS